MRLQTSTDPKHAPDAPSFLSDHSTPGGAERTYRALSLRDRRDKECPTCVQPLEQTSPSSGYEPLLVISERKSVKCPCPLDLLYRPRGDNNRELQLYKICQIMRLWRLGFARKEVCLVSLSQACCARHKWIMIGNAVVQSTPNFAEQHCD